ncbi:MAG: AAA domain-containing protein [Cyclobacteriaceae bacterium]|nr:AAA domain-containing protein [Cyclobacteriaceae bacterium]
MNAEEHFSLLQTLLRIEREEDRSQYEKKIRNRSLEDRRRDGVCWYPVSVRKSYLGIGEKWTIELERTGGMGQRHLFQSGTSASLFLQRDKNPISSTGIISRINEDRLTIVLNRDDPPDWLDDGKLGIDLLFDESTYDEMDRTLGRLKHIKEGRTNDFINIFHGEKAPSFAPVHDVRFPYLNDSQNEALNLIRSARDLALVHGPPGTGKTTTLVQAIIETVSIEKQVLICAPSNAAVDLLVEKLHNQNISVVRLGHPARVTEEVVSHTLDAQLATHHDAHYLKEIRKKSEEMKRLGLKYKRKFGREEAFQRKMLLAESKKLKEEALHLEDYMIRDVLDHAAVIACTLIGANSQYLHHRTFKTVFIDESSQAMEPAAWVPIMRAGRVIMAGDHLQLPPTVKSAEAAKNGLADTLFEHSIRNFSVARMLNVQYRMHPDIMAFSNDVFYTNQLQCSEQILRRQPLFTEAVEFIDTAGCGFAEELNPETLSTFNKEEARFVLDHLNQLAEHTADIKKMSIGIIAPYKAQVEQLRLQFSHVFPDSDSFENLTINTVDAFQGQERDILYISLTRSNDRGIVGFLADQRRMNVAMTRARHKLVMVGDSATLCAEPFFDMLIRFFQDKGHYHSAFEYIYR